MKVFIDAGGYIALFDSSDQFHEPTQVFLSRLGEEIRPHTSNYVIDEVITFLSSRRGHWAALKFIDFIFSSQIIAIHYIDEDIEHKSLSLFRRYSDKNFSFTDITTIALLEKLNINRLLSFDQEFKKLGYLLVPI